MTPAADDLRTHIPNADPAILLASLVSMTGGIDRLEEFVPHLTYAPRPGGLGSQLPEGQRAALNEWALEVLLNPAIHDGRHFEQPDDTTFLTLAQSLVGWPSEPSSIPFLKEQAGFVSFVPTVPRSRQPDGFSVAIVGAGMAGIGAAIALEKAGFDFTVLEKKDGVGGVWRQNTYPGVGVDTPTKYYSFSWEINPDWTTNHPLGGEYLDYLERVAREYGVIDRFHFGAEVTHLVWDEHRQVWRVTYLQDGQRIEMTANAVVTAAGYLTNPQLPDVPGVTSFGGRWFHSAEWDHEYDFTGKRLAVVGTGCTSVQVVDALGDTVESLTLFQRQPHWVLPSDGKNEIPDSERWLLANVPEYATWARLHTFLLIGDANYDAVRYDEDWASTHETSISARNDIPMQLGLGHLNASFKDRPDLMEKLTPDFAVYGKRPIRDPGAYYETLKKPTTTLVTSGLREVVPDGIIDGDGNFHEVDAIVYATGFTLEYLSNWAIVGRDGEELAAKWQDSPKAYNGCLVPGFPNLFITSGPNASAAHGGGHNFTVEAVVHYLIESLQSVVERDARSFEVTAEAYKSWDEEVHALMADSVWAREQRATTYYRNSKGDVILASPMKMEQYWNRLRAPNMDDLIIQ